jgi:hypothetical protein
LVVEVSGEMGVVRLGRPTRHTHQVSSGRADAVHLAKRAGGPGGKFDVVVAQIQEGEGSSDVY